MKGKKKKRRQSNPVEESKQGMKKTIKKSIKGTLLEKNNAKKLGANEADENHLAFGQREDILADSLKKKEELIQ